MKKRIAKKKGKVVNSELWNLDITIAKFVLPRLKRFKVDTMTYPGRDDMQTFEDWQECLDKMIKAFDLIVNDPELTDWENYKDGNLTSKDYELLCKQRNSDVEEGLMLFAKWYRDLWW